MQKSSLKNELYQYYLLMRLDKPVGIFLLFFPCAFGVILGAFAANTPIDLTKLVLFFTGSILMRSCGCVINDITDRKLDAKVARTKNRPLAAENLAVINAYILVFVLLTLSFITAIALGPQVIIMSFYALPLVIIYPFMKRITYMPQAFLGCAMNFGVLMGYAVIVGQLDLPALLFYAACIFWTIGYDTIYAYQDIKDDKKAGVKSTALLFGKRGKLAVSICYITFFLLILLSLQLTTTLKYSMVTLILPAIHLAWQVKSWDINNENSSLKIFKSNSAFALLLSSAMAAIAI